VPQIIIVGIEKSCVEGECVKGVWTGRVRGLRGHKAETFCWFHSTREIYPTQISTTSTFYHEMKRVLRYGDTMKQLYFLSI